MRPAWQSPSRPPVPSQSSSSSAGLALNSAHFPPPSSSLLPPERPSHGSHSAGAGVVREPKETSNSLFGGGTETALDRVMNMLEGFEVRAPSSSSLQAAPGLQQGRAAGGNS